MRLVSIMILSGMLAACQTTGGRGGAFCDVERPTRLRAEVVARMNHGELAAAVARNRFGAKQCGWRPLEAGAGRPRW